MKRNEAGPAVKAYVERMAPHLPSKTSIASHLGISVALVCYHLAKMGIKTKRQTRYAQRKSPAQSTYLKQRGSLTALRADNHAGGYGLVPPSFRAPYSSECEGHANGLPCAGVAPAPRRSLCPPCKTANERHAAARRSNPK